jgi:hypothetical protein
MIHDIIATKVAKNGLSGLFAHSGIGNLDSSSFLAALKCCSWLDERESKHECSSPVKAQHVSLSIVSYIKSFVPENNNPTGVME